MAYNRRVFQKDTYIVLLMGEDKHEEWFEWKVNYVYKQRITDSKFSPYKNCSPQITPTLSNLDLSNPSLKLFNWRFASSKEIAHYNKVNQPFHMNEAMYSIDSIIENLNKLENKINGRL